MADTKPYTIVLAIGEPDHWLPLTALAEPLARARNGRVLPLYVGRTAEPPSWLEMMPRDEDVVAQPVVVAATEVGQAVIRYTREVEADLLMVLWSGELSRGRYLLGRTLDPIIQFGACDVAVLRLGGAKPQAFAESVAHARRVLVPTGGGPNATMAVDIALDMCPEARVTALRVASKTLNPTGISAQWEALRLIIEGIDDQTRVRPHVELANSVTEGILREANQGYEMVLIGATRESLVDRLLFGNLPQRLSEQIKQPLIIVRRRDPFAQHALRQARWRLLQALPQLTMQERISIYQTVRRGARTDADFYVMMVLATAIAALGLLLNSSAVIIGAMIIAPLMSALLGLSLGVVQGDFWLVRVSIRTLLLGIVLSLGVSILLAVIVPQRKVTAEMIGRSSPTLLDLAVALASGAAAAYASSRRDVANALAGVAIAVALLPPLATVGLAFVIGAQVVALGAGLLFLTNLVAIVSAAGLFFFLMGFHPDVGEKDRERTFRSGLWGTLSLLIAITAILATLTVDAVQQSRFDHAVEATLEREIELLGQDVALEGWRTVGRRGSTVAIEVELQSAADLTSEEAQQVEDALAASLDQPVDLALIITRVQRLDAGAGND
ncbi:MAG: DUF389 domain-containing protein [Anaerolineae bacterium]